MIQLSGLDSMFFHMETDQLPMHISSCSIFKRDMTRGDKPGNPTFDDIKNIFENHLLKDVQTLTCKLKNVAYNLDQPYWVKDPDFHLDFHLSHMALPDGQDWDALKTVLGRLHSKPLDRSKALWEAVVIDGLDNVEGCPPGCFALFMKVHHSIMDGRTGMNIMTSLLSMSPDALPMSTSSDAELGPDLFKRPTMMETFSRGYTNNLKRMSRMTTLFGRELPKVASRLGMATRRGEITTIQNKEKTRFNEDVTSGRTVDRIKLPLDEIKQISKAVEGGVKVNDVMIAVVGGAMKRYLEAKGEAPEHSLTTGAPVDVRGESDESIRGNLLTFMSISMCTHIEDPVARLQQIHLDSNNAKQFTEGLGKGTLNQTLDSLYSGVFAFGLRTVVKKGLVGKLPVIVNTIVSNVPNIPCKLYLAGAEMFDGVSMGPLVPNIGLFHVVSGFENDVVISVTACAEAMPDSDFYAKCLNEAYDEVRDAVLGRKNVSNVEKIAC